MNILFSSAFVLLVLLLITQFTNFKQSKILRSLAVFGILVGIVSIIYVSFFASKVSMVYPLEINTENGTTQNLKIYAVTFVKDQNDSINKKVFFDAEIAPTNTSKFSINADDENSFWIVAKNDQNDIKFLKEVKRNNEKINLKITDNEVVDQKNAQTARELIFDFDIKKQILNFIIWSNIILMLLLSWSILKLKKAPKEPQFTE